MSYHRGGGGNRNRGGGPDERDSLGATDRSQRSVFVGNISYEATEEQIRDVFAQVGPVVHFRLVHDRDTNKPKGYGFCEFVDQQTADSAIRNLNGYELHGRPLRVDSAAGSDRNVEEMQQLQMTLAGAQQHEESPYGATPMPGKAPEAISRAVASLPPEQMFELMKQMKMCVQNNPNEARNMLLANPQLAYALLQAQVVMRIVEPQVAITMLHRDAPPPIANVNEPFHTQVSPFVPPAGIPPLLQQQQHPYGGMPAPSYSGGAGGGGVMPIRMAPPMQQQQPPTTDEEQEKAALLVQVLQMSDEQIQMLAPDERQQVLTLRNSLRNVTQ